jgi:hypothetical protein
MRGEREIREHAFSEGLSRDEDAVVKHGHPCEESIMSLASHHPIALRNLQAIRPDASRCKPASSMSVVLALAQVEVRPTGESFLG